MMSNIIHVGSAPKYLLDPGVLRHFWIKVSQSGCTFYESYVRRDLSTPRFPKSYSV